MSKKVYTPGLSTSEILQKKREERYGHTAAPETDILAGHSTLTFTGDDLTEIFGPVHETDLEIGDYTILTAQIAAYPKSSMTSADWNAIRDGKWTIEQLTSLIYANDLPAPANKRKEDLISLVMENKEHIS